MAKKPALFEELFGKYAREQPERLIKFKEWLDKNEEFWKEYKKWAHYIRKIGFKYYGSKAIVERVRWHLDVKAKGETRFKICNDFTSLLARLLIYNDESFKGFFELREPNGEDIMSLEERYRIEHDIGPYDRPLH